MKLVIDISDETYDEVRHYGLNLCPRDREALEKAFKTCKLLPKDATNGDMIETMFQDVEVKEKNNGYEVYFGIGTAIQFFNHQWWNTPYKRGEKDD